MNSHSQLFRTNLRFVSPSITPFYISSEISVLVLRNAKAQRLVLENILKGAICRCEKAKNWLSSKVLITLVYTLLKLPAKMRRWAGALIMGLCQEINQTISKLFFRSTARQNLQLSKRP